MYATLKPRNGTPIPTPLHLFNPPYLTLCRRNGGRDSNFFEPTFFLDPKIFWPKNFEFFPTKHFFATQFFFHQNFFQTKNFFGRKFFGLKIFSNIFGTKHLLDLIFFIIKSFRPRIFWTQYSFGFKHFSEPKIFLDQKTFCQKTFFSPRIFLGSKSFLNPKIIFVPQFFIWTKIFRTKIFFDQKFSDPNFYWTKKI